MVLPRAALYGQVAWTFGSRLSVLPGVRLELHERVGLVSAPRLAARYLLDDKVVLRASFGRGFRVPSAKEYGFLFDHSALGYRVIGNPDVQPESSWGVNADVGVRLAPQVRLRVAAFHNWVKNLIDTAYVGRSSPGVDDYSYVNVGHARTMGSQASVAWEIVPQVRSELAYSYLFTRNDDLGQPLALRPEHSLVNSLGYEPWDGTQLTLRQRAVSSAFVAPGVDTPAYLISDILCDQALWGGLRAQVGVLNFLNTQRDPLREGDLRPALGRLLFLGLSAEYPNEAQP